MAHGTRLVALLLIFVCHQATYQTVAQLFAHFNDISIVYPSGIPSEASMPECTKNAACNILHRRFWFPMTVLRQCQCPQRSECSMQWASSPQPNTQHIDNRSQMKFCEDISELGACTVGSPALTFTHHKAQGKLTYMIHYVNETRLLCNCPAQRYWKLTNVNHTSDHEFVETYQCETLQFCARGNFCGHVRADLYSTYYQCTCPPRHMCLIQDYKKNVVKELHFEGPAYSGVCTRMTE